MATVKDSVSATAEGPIDRVAAARAKAEAYKNAKSQAMGTMSGLPADHHGYWFCPAELGPGRSDTLRADLLARGFELVEGATVAGVSNPEVWAIPDLAYHILRG